ncbi:helix-turn-helix domain-containing protein [Leucobacter sp. BZR 635]
MAINVETSEGVSERPPTGADVQDSRERFAADLRSLKLTAGDPTLLALESRTGISKSVLSEAFSGKRLPTEKTVRVLTTELNADADAWLARRQTLIPGLPQSGSVDLGDVAGGRPRRAGRILALLAATAVLSVGASSLVWWNVLQSRENYWSSQRPALAGNEYLDPVDGVDPMKTECRHDRVIADVGPRHDGAVQIEMLYSNSCMGVWGRVTRVDGSADGNTLSMRIYPKDDPQSSRSQERTAESVNSLYTPLLIEPNVEARVCGIATMTVDGEEVELGPPMCV